MTGSARVRQWLSSLAQPTLVRRSMVAVLAAFVLVFVVLLGYVYVRNAQIVASDPGLLRFGNALARSLQPLHTDAEATAAVSSTDIWQNIRRAEDGRFSGRTLYELLDGAGRRLYASPSLGAEALPSPARPMERHTVLGGTHRLFEATVTGAAGRPWTLRLAEPLRTRQAFLRWNSRVILEYLVLALPCVLLPLWLSVRSGLRPLRALAGQMAARRADDLSPLGAAPRHRELLPLVQALDGLLARARHTVERERGFLHDAAHELRTPLAVVAAQAHAMAHAGTDERLAAYDRLQQAIARASHLAQQLLALAALDTAARRLPPRAIDVAQATRQWLAQAAPAALARGIDLSLAAPDRLDVVLDEPAFESIVGNLVDNAVRYGRPGGSVAVELHADAGRLHLRVQDDGPGITPADRARVFERFWRGAGHDAPGTGLGLAIVRQAVQHLGGSVHIADAAPAGPGVAFVVSIPVPTTTNPPATRP